MKNFTKPKLRLISETIPDEFITKTVSVGDIFEATDEFFDDNFRGAITVDNELTADGYVNISPDGFAFFHKVLLNAIFGESVVRLRMLCENSCFLVEARWKVYKSISNSDLALLRSTANLSGFSMTLNEDEKEGKLTLSMPIRATPYLAIYAVSIAKMREAFTRVFFL